MNIMYIFLFLFFNIFTVYLRSALSDTSTEVT